LKKIFGLGKGLNSLIPTSTDGKKFDSNDKENVFYVEVNKIKPNSEQPRQDFDQEGIKELSKSIKRYGVLQPLLVTKKEETSGRGLNVYYQLIAGERRLRAAQLAGIPSVPVIIRDDFKAPNIRLEVALIENIQRKDLNPMEESEAYDSLQRRFGLTQKEIAVKVSKSREAVTNSLRLLKLPKDIKESLRANIISRAHARALLAFGNAEKQREVYQHIVSGRLSSREVEKMASTSKGSKSRVKIPNKFIELQDNLAKTLKVPVLISNSDKGGKITIKFATLQELNKIAKNIID
jgi:ParB family transcriptional regulator, chromosome partitioning protein